MARRIALGVVLATVVVAALALGFGQRAIGEALFAQAIRERVGTDPSKTLPDGLHAYICGTGSPLPDKDRAGPCITVLAGQTGLVFDAGSGSVRKLGAMGFPMQRLEAAFLTHVHSDHIDGMGELLLQAWMAGGRSAPLPVYGPPDTAQVVEGFDAAYTPDRALRIAHHGPAVARPTGFGGEPREFVPEGLKDGVVYAADGVTVTALRVPHGPVKHAYAYRVDYKGRAIVISGDLSYHPPLGAFAKGADVLFHEALNPDLVGQIGAQAKKSGMGDAARIMSDIPGYHTSPQDAARVAAAAKVRALVFYHVIPAPPFAFLDAAFLGDAPKAYGGEIRIAKDGLLVSLPAGGKAIDYKMLL
ncbi:MAG: MBL fold metallo-hydrolase [Erythrobacter sp.]